MHPADTATVGGARVDTWAYAIDCDVPVDLPDGVESSGAVRAMNRLAPTTTDCLEGHR